ncbi:MAG: hypothetical protein GXY07_02385 [Candidatus Hydrogenedentes bacterium]|nr:hypothetical protein [Candidatus Hydrogenedentota bacterium]
MISFNGRHYATPVEKVYIYPPIFFIPNNMHSKEYKCGDFMDSSYSPEMVSAGWGQVVDNFLKEATQYIVFNGLLPRQPADPVLHPTHFVTENHDPNFGVKTAFQLQKRQLFYSQC